MPSTREQISVGVWFRWYLGTLILGVVVAIAMDVLFHLHPMRGGLLYFGLLFIAAAANRPRALFLMIRSVRWFGLIDSDRTVRAWMWAFGVAALLAAIFLPNTGA
jgi:hypothetical protein